MGKWNDKKPFLKVIFWAIKVRSYIHTYIIGQYNPSVRIIALVSYTTYVVASTPNDRFFEKLSMSILLNLRKKTLFVFCFNVWTGARTLAFPLISQHTTY